MCTIHYWSNDSLMGHNGSYAFATGYHRGYPRGVMVKSLDYGIVVSKFDLQSCYYIHFRTNTLGKCMNPPILLAMG